MKMEKDNFLGLCCMKTAIPQGEFIDKQLELLTYTGKSADFMTFHPDGRMELLSEDERAIRTLNEGKGVLYKGEVYFLESCMESSRFYQLFKKAYLLFLKQLTKSETILLKHLYEPHSFHLVKSMLTLFGKGILNREATRTKLESYLPKATIVLLMNFVEQQNQVAV